MKIRQKLDMKLIGYLATFEKITRASAVDFFENKDQLIFMVDEAFVMRAVGKGGINIKKLAYLLKRKIKIIALTKDPKMFVLSLIYPIKPFSMEKTDEFINIRLSSTEEKARVIGRGASNISFINSLLERHYKLKLRLV